MQLISLLENLAKTAHHRIHLTEELNHQPEQIRNAFLVNDGGALKRSLGDVINLADRDKVVCIEK